MRYVHKNDHQADHLIEVDLLQQIRGPDDLDYFLWPWHVSHVLYVQGTKDMDLSLGLYIWNCIDPLRCMRLKKVDLDDVALHISNYRISVEDPLRGVEAISEGLPILPELVWISFRRPTEFGNKVVFMPKLRFFIRVSPHLIVNELRQLVSEARVQH